MLTYHQHHQSWEKQFFHTPLRPVRFQGGQKGRGLAFPTSVFLKVDPALVKKIDLLKRSGWPQHLVPQADPRGVEGSAVCVGRELLPCLNVNVQLFLPPFLQESCYVKSMNLSGLWRGFEVCFLLALGPHLCGGASHCVSLLQSLAHLRRTRQLPPVLQTGRKDSLASAMPPNIAS